MDRAETIRKLLTTFHLNVSERASLGEAPILRSEIIQEIRGLIQESGFFPVQAEPWKSGQLVFEGCFLQLLTNGVRLHWQRAQAIAPRVLAESGHQDFPEMLRGIEAFIDREWPGGLDGLLFR